MVLDRIQSYLEAIYNLECELKVSEHLITAEQARALGGKAEHEELLVSQEGETMELGLFVDPALLARLETAKSPFEDFAGFCEATEGVSHFMYTVRAASLDRQLSLLELEAQAEVDKFASCILLSWSQLDATQLHQHLFDRVAFRSGLSDDERWRYREANRVARNYCRRLLRHVARRRVDELLSELRQTYRMGAEAKLKRLSVSL